MTIREFPRNAASERNIFTLTMNHIACSSFADAEQTTLSNISWLPSPVKFVMFHDYVFILEE